jgi:hypothetical protein
MSREDEEKTKRALAANLENPIVKVLVVEVIALVLRALKEWIDNGATE